MRGWRLREGWEGADGGGDRPSALDTDLAACGEAVLPKEIAAAAVDSIPGPVVLQLLKVKNVSAPTENQGSGHAPRMLKLQLTDGHTKCFGLELDPPIKVTQQILISHCSLAALLSLATRLDWMEPWCDRALSTAL